MARYRKKPIVIDAIRFTGNYEKIFKWISQWEPEDDGHGIWESNDGLPEKGLIIDTLEGELRADKGDFIIRDIAGELYPCKPKIFKQTYEKCKKQDERAGTYTRLSAFFEEQKRHWQRLLKGKIPEPEIINGWIESCDFAEEDLKTITEGR